MSITLLLKLDWIKGCHLLCNLYLKPQCLILKTTSKRWVGLEPKMNAELQDVCPPPPHRPPSPLFPRIRCTLCPLRKFALFIRLKFSYPQCTHRTHHAMDAVHRVWILLLTIYKVLRLYNLPPTLLTLRYLAFQEVCIRYKLESTPHTAEFQQICKYTCNTTHNNLQSFSSRTHTHKKKKVPL